MIAPAGMPRATPDGVRCFAECARNH